MSLAPHDCPTAAPTEAEAATILADARQAVVATSLGSFTIELDALRLRLRRPTSSPWHAATSTQASPSIGSSPVSLPRPAIPRRGRNRGTFNGLGGGGPGYQFEVEFPEASQPYDRYTVAMANAMQYDPTTGQITGGKDTNGSQFFIDLADLAGQLRPYYSVIGKVTDGTDVVDSIGSVAVNDPSAGVPVEPVVIESVTIKSGA